MAVGEIVPLVQVLPLLAWPVVAVIALAWLRRPLSTFLEDLGHSERSLKFSIAMVGVEIGAGNARELAPTWTVDEFDLRKATPASLLKRNELKSAAPALVEPIEGRAHADYAIVDLGIGQQWLTSRLFIFSIILEKMSGLKTFVFLESRAEGRTPRQFLGTASPSDIRWALAMKYPWLEAGFAKAYFDITPKPSQSSQLPWLESWGDGTQQQASQALDHSSEVSTSYTTPQWIFSKQGELRPDYAKKLFTNFLSAIQRSTPQDADASTPVSPAPGSGDDAVKRSTSQYVDASNWVSVENKDLQEHAEWIDGRLLDRVLGSALNRSYISYSPDVPLVEQAKAVLRRPGPFVALVEEGKTFRSLIDRQAFLEKAAEFIATPSLDRPEKSK